MSVAEKLIEEISQRRQSIERDAGTYDG